MQEKTVIYLAETLFAFLVLGILSCGGARKIALDPESRDFYETTKLIMTKHEKAIFNHLPDKESREEFIHDFWAKRDSDPDTEENEFKEEFLRRIEYANLHFKEGPPGWKTDRGRIYIYLGPPDKVDEIFTHLEYDYKDEKIRGSILFWIYYRYNLGIKFVDKSGIHHFTLDPYSGIIGDLLNAIEMAKLGVSIEDIFTKKFMNFNVEFNREKKEIVITIPVKFLTFIEKEGLLKADFEFEFHIYEKEGLWKDKFKEIKSFAKPEDEVLELEYIIFTFPYDLNPGKYYFDVIVIGKEGIGKARKIFVIKI